MTRHSSKSFRHLMESDEEDYDYQYDNDNDNDDAVVASAGEDGEETSPSADSQSSGQASPAAAIASGEATVGDSDWEVLSSHEDGDWVDVNRRSRSNSVVSDISSSWVRCGKSEDMRSEAGDSDVKPTMAQLLQPSHTGGSRGALPRPHGVHGMPPLSKRKPALKSINEAAPPRGNDEFEDDLDPMEFGDLRGHRSRAAGKLPRNTKLMNRVNNSKEQRQAQRSGASG